MYLKEKAEKKTENQSIPLQQVYKYSTLRQLTENNGKEQVKTN